MASIGASLGKHELAVRRIVLFALLYAVAPFQAMLPVTDPDIWWHLRVGEWIAANRTVPYQDYFSTYGNGKPWLAYSWLFEVLLHALHAHLGLLGIVLFTVSMALAITLAVHGLVRLARAPIIVEVALTAAAVAAMKPLLSPRPWLFTIVFFAVELILILLARDEQKTRWLWWLPPIFILWTNLHIQFVYGLAVLGLLVTESLIMAAPRWYGRPPSHHALPLVPLLGITAASFLATLISPYHVWIYKPIWEYIGQTGAFENISELHAMYFRSADEWIILALTLAAVFSLGRRRRWLPFSMLLLLFGTFLGFRARRDIWFLVTVAVAIVARQFRNHCPTTAFTLTRGQRAVVVALVALALYGIGSSRQINEPALQAVVAKEYPVDAAAFVRRNQLPGPLFNTLDWGGYLIWSLQHLPVAIDGRTNLHGDRRLAVLWGVWQGQPGWDSNSELLSAKLIIADHGRPLTWLLRRDARYRIAYEDRTALVFTPTQQIEHRK